MKNVFIPFLSSVFAILLSSNFLFAQCTLTGNGSGIAFSQAQVLTCLGMCTNCTITITGGIVDLGEPWDLTSKGNIAITIAAGASLRFSAGDLLTLTAGSSVTLVGNGALIEDITNDADPVILKGTQSITAGQLSTYNSSNGILPVVLKSFEGRVQVESVNLTWQTSTELNNAKFIIETSPLGEVFQSLGEVAGAGTTTEPQNYRFTHHTPSAGINYYRLKQVDFDGTFEYSKVIAIEAAGSQDIFAFPNPAREKITLQYDQSKGAGNIQLLDGLGRRINASIAGYAGNYELTLPESLARGTYWLKVERGGRVQTLPVVKE